MDAAVITEGQESLNKNDPNKTAKTTGGTGVGMAMAPVVYKGKVIIGITGVGYGLHIATRVLRYILMRLAMR